MEFFIYVDSLTGDDSNPGDILHPFKTLSAAYNYAVNGATIVLQSGDSTSYGDLSITKNINIIAAYGSAPLVGTLTVTKAQCFLQCLTFNNLNKGVVVNNVPYGSVQVKDCIFNKVFTGIEINKTDYIAIHTNTFKDEDKTIPAIYKGIVINSAKEVNISNNIFSDQIISIEVSDIYRLDIWNNTIYGGETNPSSPTSSHDNLRVVYFTLNSIDINNKRVILPTFASEHSIIANRFDAMTNSVNGPALEYSNELEHDYSKDYTITGGGITLSWNGYALDGLLRVGDKLRVMYVEGSDISGGAAIRAIGVVDPNSTIDSNNITGYVSSPEDHGIKIQYGIFFNSPLTIKNNNFYSVEVFYLGTAYTGVNNISANPLYNLEYPSYSSRDFGLNTVDSPSREAGDNDRWERLSYEMGITGSDAGVTALGTITREGVAPFNRGIDNYKVDRIRYNVDKEEKLDIGAIEFIGSNPSETGIFYIGETGSDYGNYYGKNKDDALITIDRAFKRDSPSINEINVGVGGITGIEDGTRYGRYFSKNMELNSRSVNTNRGTNQDIIYVYPTTPKYTSGAVYVSPNGLDGETGIVGYTGVFGETGSILYGFTGGNGTSTMPYRTITKAIQSGGAYYVIVEPGFYPTFSGATGVNIIGIPKTSTITLNTPSYQKLKESDWGVTGVGAASFSNNTLYITGTEYVFSNFTTDNRLEYKSVVNINSDTFIFKLDNVSNYVSVIFNSTSLKIRFYNGTTYTYNYVFSDFGVNVKIRIVISGSKVEVFINGPTTNIYRDFLLISSYIGNWGVSYDTTGGTETIISKFFISSGTITFVVPDTETNIRHKLYGLFGSKTL